MKSVQFSDIITAPVWGRPSCKCSAFIIYPVNSHGIYLIGAYKVPSVLSRRGNHVTRQSVDYRFANGGSSVALFAGASNDDQRAWFI